MGRGLAAALPGISGAALALALGACGFGINLDGLAGPSDSGADAIPTVGGLGIGAGNDASCVVRQDGSVACWGDGSHLGNGSFTDSSSPVLVSGLNDAVQVSVGNWHACAVRKTGQVACWGRNWSGMLGNGSTDDSPTPVLAAGISDAVAVSSGYETTCAAKKDGTVFCWGADDYGEVGNGTTAGSVPIPVPAAGITDAIGVATGTQHACAVTKAGAVYCWGRGVYGENGDPNNASQSSPQLVAGIGNAAALGAGDHYTCALTTDGHVSCWGVSWNGRLGNPATNTTPVPSDTGLSNVSALSVGISHACVLKSDATVACWGDNDVGECGVGAHGGSLQVPVPVSNLSGVAAVASGYNHSCALLTSGKVSCWGGNMTGALGQGTTVLTPQPTPVPGETNTADVACGDDFTCAARKDGTVSCWGNNDTLQLGATAPPLTATPTVVPNLSGVTKIKSGPDAQTACVVGGGNAVTCWGNDDYGQLGNDNNGDPEIPTPFGVAGTQLVVGVHDVCVLAMDGTVPCAGYNADGQLGNGTTTGSSATPTAATGVAGATLIGGGTAHVCALATGGLLCWGDDDNGQLGDNKTAAGVGTPQPAPAVTFGAPLDISGGSDFTCLIAPGGDVYCLGTGGSGQMGSGSLSGSKTPVKVLSLTQPAVQLALGDSFACARLSDGTVSCWGDNRDGQLGNGQVTPYGTASPVKNLTDAVSIAAGSYHACAVRAGGQLVCWGSNWAGQLGDGTTMIMDSPTPVPGF
ncbi:MAG TPA: hypothetical protein VLM85_05100 [Polyangiaceae bacterium]|nr:hypothetical protein [Polyangiaceae bacterium]